MEWAPLFLSASAVLLVSTAAIHSIVGQRRLIGPLLVQTNGVLEFPLVRFLIVFAWHLTSATWLVLASILLAWAWAPESAMQIGLVTTGFVFTISGIWDAIASKGRHIGWAPLTLIGLSAMAALTL